MNRTSNSRVMRLVFSAMMIALATVLSIIQIKLPFGGSVTPGSMVPLVIVCQLYGFGRGAAACFAFSLIQLLLGSGNLAYAVTGLAAAAIIIFDYVVAFSAVSLSALTAKMKKRPAAAAVGTVIGCSARYLCHVISGATVWKEYASVSYIPAFLRGTFITNDPNVLYWAYSVCYNGVYMIPETIITAVLSAVVMKFVKFDRLTIK